MGFFKSKKVLVLAALLVVAVGYGAYALFIKDDANHQKQPTVSTHKSSTHSNVKVTTSDSNTPKAQPSSNDNQKIDLISPSGVFVSNHRPNLDGDPAPNSMNSTCRTNPGVKCEIKFTKDGIVKNLGPDTTGQDGLISWDWKLQDVGLTAGTWQVTAISTYGTQSLSVTDSISLEVGE